MPTKKMMSTTLPPAMLWRKIQSIYDVAKAHRRRRMGLGAEGRERAQRFLVAQVVRKVAVLERAVVAGLGRVELREAQLASENLANAVHLRLCGGQRERTRRLKQISTH